MVLRFLATHLLSDLLDGEALEIVAFAVSLWQYRLHVFCQYVERETVVIVVFGIVIKLKDFMDITIIIIFKFCAALYIFFRNCTWFYRFSLPVQH